jgi:hypothetical protein
MAHQSWTVKKDEKASHLVGKALLEEIRTFESTEKEKRLTCGKLKVTAKGI